MTKTVDVIRGSPGSQLFPGLGLLRGTPGQMSPAQGPIGDPRTTSTASIENQGILALTVVRVDQGDNCGAAVRLQVGPTARVTTQKRVPESNRPFNYYTMTLKSRSYDHSIEPF